ncbi:MAG: hypothetical protein GWN00_19900 [Aliifodinibius sp.]|nr:hypothetical protein [Fodinibius sp.]NIY26985.1 hypothetical protein [Fodinibius sp.]
MKAEDLINDLMTKARELDDKELSRLFPTLGATAIGCMRGMHGDQFVTDYLKAALDDQEKFTLMKSNH